MATQSAFLTNVTNLNPHVLRWPGGSASEDYSELVAAGMPKSVFFQIGGYDPKMIAEYKAQGKPVPVNHSPYFAPVPEPTIRTGVEAMSLVVMNVMQPGAPKVADKQDDKAGAKSGEKSGGKSSDKSGAKQSAAKTCRFKILSLCL